MKKRYFGLFAIALALVSLSGCSKASATFIDITADSIYGKLSNFSPSGLCEGDTLTFTVTPSDYFKIKKITNNGVECERVKVNPDGSAIYSTVLKAGENKLKGEYHVDKTVDFVDEFKLDVSDEVFSKVMSYSENKTGVATEVDFRKSGIEQCRAPNKWDKTKHTKTSRLSDKNYFINFVDGDTTHVETYNLQYTVKIRYLSIDTPESTSDIEEWGLSASYYSKYIYTGLDEYKNYIINTMNEDDIPTLKAGITSLILVSQAASIHSKDIRLSDLKIGSEEPGPYAATTDGNQRNLAYVWYSTAENPTKDTFRCLNLEMVYQGFSSGVGSKEDTSEYYYRMFDAANLSAQANKRHMYSDNDDPNYHYYERPGQPIFDLKLSDLYNSAPKDPDIGYYPESVYANRKSIYAIEGYVSRKVGTSFYIQDKPSYTAQEVAEGKCFGLYVFTYSVTPINVGHHVRVVGALSSYGGTFQMQGIVWSEADMDNPRNTKIIGGIRTKVDIVPIQVTGEQFNSLKLQQVLVEITDNIWFYPFTSTYDGNEEFLGEGGSEEVNKYNTAYPFYNTSNAPIFYGSFGETDNAAELQAKAGNDGVRYSNSVIRFTLNQEILCRYLTETSYSFRFFTGGEYIYNPKGAQYANFDPANKYLTLSVTKSFNRKMHPKHDGEQHGIIVISHGYESTGGNKKMTATICSGSINDVSLQEVTE